MTQHEKTLARQRSFPGMPLSETEPHGEQMEAE